MKKEDINTIAQNLDCGFRCYIHKDTKAMKFIPDLDQHPDMELDAWKKDISEIQKNLKAFVEIIGMDSRETYQLMIRFIETVDHDETKIKLEQAISGAKPFRNFKFQVDNSGVYREKWFKFKEENLMDWIEDQLKVSSL